MSITATISTKERYNTTLPLTLMGIATQTFPPSRVIIFDDNIKPVDLRGHPVYNAGIFPLLSSKGISWEVIYGQKRGQVANHQKALEIAKTEFIWRIDDDEVPEYNVLEKLFKTMKEDKTIGAIGGLVLHPGNVHHNPKASNAIEDIFIGMNIQWFKQSTHDLIPVDHLYSTFLYRKTAGKHGYCVELSVVGHREETIFTHEMKRNGWKLYVYPDCVTWHFRQPSGGIREYHDGTLWEQDEQVFKRKLLSWKTLTKEHKLIIMDNGLGDHWVLKRLLPDIRKKYSDRKIILALCYPDVFYDVKDISIISIAEAIQMVPDIGPYNIYRWMLEHNWKGQLIDAFRSMLQL